MAAEAEAEQLRGQLASANERADKAGAMAALREAARSDGELNALRQKVATLQAAHDNIAAKVEQSFGENGVSVNDGVAHGSGAAGGTQTPELPIETVNISKFGDIYQAKVVILQMTLLPLPS